jgi:hypothetical protein
MRTPLYSSFVQYLAIALQYVIVSAHPLSAFEADESETASVAMFNNYI